MCCVVFIYHSLHCGYIKTALDEYVIKQIIPAFHRILRWRPIFEMEDGIAYCGAFNRHITLKAANKLKSLKDRGKLQLLTMIYFKDTVHTNT